MLKVWVDAQNTQDFDTYKNLYAGEFSGVKRAGSRTYRMGRPQWLRDRKGMFRRPFTVTIDDVESMAIRGGSSILVRFTQTWASPRFQDRGRKQIRLLREQPEGPWRIGHEEMMDSSLRQDPRRNVAPGAFMWVVHVAGEPHVMLTDQCKDGWAEGESLLMDRMSTVPAARKRARDLPAEISTLVNRHVDVYEKHNHRCRARIGRPIVLARVTAIFLNPEGWRRFPASNPQKGSGQDNRLSDAELAQEVWDLSPGGRVIAAPLRPSSEKPGECTEGQWARLTDLPTPTFYLDSEDEHHGSRVLPQYRASEGYRTIQSEAEKEGQVATGEDWSTDRSEGSTWVPISMQFTKQSTEQSTEQSIKQAPPHFIMIHSEFSGDDCAAWGADFWALYGLKSGTANPRWEALTDETSPGEHAPHWLMDLDSDGNPELMTHDTLFSIESKSVKVIQKNHIPNYNCPC